MDNQKITKERFEELFNKNLDYYEKQTKQDDEIEEIIKHLNINDKSNIVDLGTGTGYIAFKIAKAFPKVNVIGVDIINNILKKNSEKANCEGLNNLKFKETNGIILPFKDESIDCIVTRFALHHFVDIEKSFSEFKRVLKSGGQLFISDPTPNKEDKERFVDRFMKLSKDGHITFYRKTEFDELAIKSNFILDSFYYSKITFPSKSRTEGYLKLEGSIPEDIKKSYEFKVVNEEVWATEKVINLSYIKR